MTLSFDIGKCDGSAETCIAVSQAFEADVFYECIDELATNTNIMRQMLGAFVTACVNGDCPGQNPELTKQLLRSRFRPE